VKGYLKPLYVIASLVLLSGAVLGQPASNECGSKLDTVTGREVFLFVDDMPEFQGGIELLFKFFMDNLRYPEFNRCVSGRVYVSFVVEPSGQVTSKRIIRGIDKWVDEEVLSVIGKMPNWNAGSCNGEKVPVEVIVPVNVALH